MRWAFCIGLLRWPYALALCIGLMHWPYALALCIGLVAMNYCDGLMHWPYALALLHWPYAIAHISELARLALASLEEGYTTASHSIQFC
jgi:hypothetical protein